MTKWSTLTAETKKRYNAARCTKFAQLSHASRRRHRERCRPHTQKRNRARSNETSPEREARHVKRRERETERRAARTPAQCARDKATQRAKRERRKVRARRDAATAAAHRRTSDARAQPASRPHTLRMSVAAAACFTPTRDPPRQKQRTPRLLKVHHVSMHKPPARAKPRERFHRPTIRRTHERSLVFYPSAPVTSVLQTPLIAAAQCTQPEFSALSLPAPAQPQRIAPLQAQTIATPQQMDTSFMERLFACSGAHAVVDVFRSVSPTEIGKLMLDTNFETFLVSASVDQCIDRVSAYLDAL